MKNLLFILTLSISLFSVGQSTLSDGLVAYFPLDNDAQDYSPLHINGINYNATVTHTSLRAYHQFNGTNAYIYAGNDRRNITDSLSVSVWVKTTSNDDQWVVGHYDHVPDGGFQILVNNGHAQLAGRDGSHTFYRLSDDKIISDGQWHHIVGLFAANKWVLIVDCEIRNILFTTAYAPSYGINTQPFSISKYPQLNGGVDPMHFEGGIDEIRVYNRVLSICEICELYNIQPITKLPDNIEIDELKFDFLKNNFKIYPNPAEHYFKVSLSEQSSNYANLQVFDFKGKLFIEKSFVNEIIVSTEKLKPGTYIVQVIDGEQNYSKKLIVK